MYELREATAGDDVAVGELLVESFVTAYARKMPEVEVTERRKADLRDIASKREVAKLWVVTFAQEVVGTVTVWPPGAHRSEAWIAGAGDLRQLAVHPAHSGKGVSTLLLDAAEAWVRANGWVGTCLHVRRGAKGVRALYERRGFQRREDGDLDLLPEVFLEAFFKPR